MFICFNGSFLNRRTPLLERKKKNRCSCFKNSKKGLFPKEVQEKHETRAACFKNRSSSACFKNRSKNQNFCFFVSGKKEEEGLSLFLKNCLFQEALFFCLFQEPLKESHNFLFQEKEETQNKKTSHKCLSTRKQVLFKKTRNQVLFGRTRCCSEKPGTRNQEPRC